MSAESSLKHGDEYPFDAPDRWPASALPPRATDWAHRAARGVLADLRDRRGIKWGFDEIDQQVRQEITGAITDIIWAAFREGIPK